MSRIVADANLMQLLRGLVGPTEVVDDQGRVIGTFNPPSPGDRAVYDTLHAYYTEDVMDRLLGASEGQPEFTTEEILADFERRS